MARTALLLLTLVACGQQPFPQRLDVILITADTLRADHLGFYGYAKPTSPNLDRLARDSLVFEHCQSHASNTRPSIASLMTGHLPHETKMMSIGRTNCVLAMSDNGHSVKWSGSAEKDPRTGNLRSLD